MAKLTINGVECEFDKGQTIIQAALRAGVEIPHYCYHDSLSIPANCRICLAECWAPDPRADAKLAPYMGGKLLPTCQTHAVDGLVVRTDSPKAVANQKAVMEYLLINHPLDCPVCDQAGECDLQDYSYRFGRGVSRFEESKVKQPKKDLGPHVLLYADRCIMCTRCVRFTREVTGTSELLVQGRGNQEQIDVFPGVPLDNELSANVIDLCPVGALLDKDFLFAQRVWFLKRTPSIDGLTASGDNIWIEHNEGRVYRLKPRTNLEVNKWWITDEVRYGWKHVHSRQRLTSPMRRRHGALIESEYVRAAEDAAAGLEKAKRIGVLVSPMLTCEDAYALARLAKRIDDKAVLAIGPVPVSGEDKVFPKGAKADDPRAFIVRAEKAPNARGVKRVLDAMGGAASFDEFVGALGSGTIDAAIITGNYPSTWAPRKLIDALDKPFCLLIDTLDTALVNSATCILPGATWMEKAGTFENANSVLQAFEQAIPCVGASRSEGQIASDLLAIIEDRAEDTTDEHVFAYIDEQPGMVPEAAELVRPRAGLFNAADARREMAERFEALRTIAGDVRMPAGEDVAEPDMVMVEL
jgi:NADH-quinone oxidoreductase subunit G